MKSSDAPNSRPGPRWRMLGLIVLAAVGALVVIWWGPQMSRQHRVMRSLITLVFLLASSVVWLLALSRLTWTTRRRALLVVIVGVAGLATSVRMRGFSGDLVPVFEWRWSGRGAELRQGTKEGVISTTPLPGSADYPQFLGPGRQGILESPVLARDWQKQPPELLWKRPVGVAWSGFAIVGRRAVTQEQRGAEECVICYDLATGGTLWEQRIAARYTSELAGEGPRATPTIDGDRCYTQGATGRLQCLDMASGTLIWSADTMAEGTIKGPAQVMEWGVSASPCIAGTMVLAAGPEETAQTTVTSLICFEKSSGAVVWKAGRSGGSYSSPLVADFQGEKQVIYFGRTAIEGYAMDSGKTRWSFPWPQTHPHVCMPLLLAGGDVLISSGYGTGSARLHISRKPDGEWTVEEIWRTNKMKAKFTNLVRVGDFVYGLDDGVLACLDARDGTLRWRDGKYRHGQVILVGSLLLLMAEDGDVVLLDSQPDARRELTRFTALAGKTWNPPALAGCYLVVRNDREAACYRLPVVRQ